MIYKITSQKTRYGTTEYRLEIRKHFLWFSWWSQWEAGPKWWQNEVYLVNEFNKWAEATKCKSAKKEKVMEFTCPSCDKKFPSAGKKVLT